MSETVVREIPGAIGPLEALVEKPAGPPRAVVVFAHPLPTGGGTMHTKAVYQATKGLARIGCVVLRFNFRGVGRSAGTWDEGPGELDDYRAALDFAAGAYPGLDIWAAGFSFGSWVALTVGASDARVCALIAVAPPVNKYDYDVVKGCVKPKFLVHGTEDELIPLRAVREFYAQLQEPKELVEIDRASHLFDGQTAEVGDALEDLLADFACSTA
ncbi:MAG: alpha/beta hydrolase [Vicinamibacterales bacterium]